MPIKIQPTTDWQVARHAHTNIKISTLPYFINAAVFVKQAALVAKIVGLRL